MLDIYDRPFSRDGQGQLHIDDSQAHHVPRYLCTIAHAWHSGQSSALYSMASCGSIASPKHAQFLIYEIADCLKSTPSPAQTEKLMQLQHYIQRYLDDHPYDEPGTDPGSSGGRSEDQP